MQYRFDPDAERETRKLQKELDCIIRKIDPCCPRTNECCLADTPSESESCGQDVIVDTVHVCNDTPFPEALDRPRTVREKIVTDEVVEKRMVCTIL